MTIWCYHRNVINSWKWKNENKFQYYITNWENLPLNWYTTWAFPFLLLIGTIAKPKLFVEWEKKTFLNSIVSTLLLENSVAWWLDAWRYNTVDVIHYLCTLSPTFFIETSVRRFFATLIKQSTMQSRQKTKIILRTSRNFTMWNCLNYTHCFALESYRRQFLPTGFIYKTRFHFDLFEEFNTEFQKCKEEKRS